MEDAVALVGACILGMSDRFWPKAAIQNRAVEKPQRMTGLRPKAVIELLLR